MEHLLRTPQGIAGHEQRSRTIEPVLGDRKHDRGIRRFPRRFPRRGLNAARREWALANLAPNMPKLHQHHAAPATA